MMELTAMVILLAVLVVALLGGFFLAWKRDQSRSDSVAEDPARLHTEAPTTTNHGTDGH